MKSTKALNFIVLLLAVVAFFIVFGSSGTDGHDTEEAGPGDFVEGTFERVYNQETGASYLVRLDEQICTMREQLAEGAAYETVGTSSYSKMDSNNKITLTTPINGYYHYFIVGNGFIIDDHGNKYNELK